jgi:hypothetical protein
MKITIKGTDQQKLHSVTISNPSDSLNIFEVVEMFCNLLKAWGFTEDSIKIAMNQCEE